MANPVLMGHQQRSTSHSFAFTDKLFHTYRWIINDYLVVTLICLTALSMLTGVLSLVLPAIPAVCIVVSTISWGSRITTYALIALGLIDYAYTNRSWIKESISNAFKAS